MHTLFISPHNDDAALFGSFIILRQPTQIVTVLDSFIQPARGYVGCDMTTRRMEDERAARILNADIYFCGLRDDLPRCALREQIQFHLARLARNTVPGRVWLPAPEGNSGHMHHELISQLGDIEFGGLDWDVKYYCTYSTRGRSTSPHRVAFESDWPRLKLLALAEYASQIALADNVDHFLRSQHEFVLG